MKVPCAETMFAKFQALEDPALQRGPEAFDRPQPVLARCRFERGEIGDAKLLVNDVDLVGLRPGIESMSRTPSGTSRRSFSSNGWSRCGADWSRCRRLSRRSRAARAAGSRQSPDRAAQPAPKGYPRRAGRPSRGNNCRRRIIANPGSRSSGGRPLLSLCENEHFSECSRGQPINLPSIKRAGDPAMPYFRPENAISFSYLPILTRFGNLP